MDINELCALALNRIAGLDAYEIFALSTLLATCFAAVFRPERKIQTRRTLQNRVIIDDQALQRRRKALSFRRVQK